MPENAILCLTKGYKGRRGYKKLIKRTLSIFKQNWAHNYDHIIFHEGNITIDDQQYIKDNLTSNADYIKFISIAHMFQQGKLLTKYARNKLCRRNFTSNRYSYGYKTMCYFWFVGFLRYCQSYSNILRIDEDCFLEPNQEDPAISVKNAVFASPFTQGMDNSNLIIGMKKLFTSFIGKSVNKWVSPYTNVMWINIKWASQPIIQKIQKTVVDSNCIFINRWGDLPLWGITLHILGKKIYPLRLDYYHESHHSIISGNKKRDLKTLLCVICIIFLIFISIFLFNKLRRQFK